MSYRLRITERAHADINRNADWWADHYSMQKATEWSRTVYDQLQSLIDFPMSCSLSMENGHVPIEIRDNMVGLGSRPRFRAVFSVQGDEVIVYTVRAAEQSAITSIDLE